MFPLYMMITTSLKTKQQTFAWPPVWVFEPTCKSYYNILFVFGGRGVGHYVLNSLLVTLASSVLAVFLGAMAAYGFARFRFRGNGHCLLHLVDPLRAAGRLYRAGLSDGPKRRAARHPACADHRSTRA